MPCATAHPPVPLACACGFQVVFDLPLSVPIFPSDRLPYGCQNPASKAKATALQRLLCQVPQLHRFKSL